MMLARGHRKPEEPRLTYHGLVEKRSIGAR